MLGQTTQTEILNIAMGTGDQCSVIIMVIGTSYLVGIFVPHFLISLQDTYINNINNIKLISAISHVCPPKSSLNMVSTKYLSGS